MDWEGKKVLVTGGAGFIGSHIIQKLVALKADVTALDVIRKTSTINLDEFKDNIGIVDIDISKKEDFDSLKTDYEHIFHLGAIGQPRVCQDNPELAFRINVMGTLNVLNFAQKNSNLKKLVFSSSTLLYGNPKYLPIDENHPIDISTNVYCLTKKIGEELCEQYSKIRNVPTVYLRLSNMFGPKQASDYIIPTIIIQAIKSKKIEVWNGEFIRDFTYIADTVFAFLKAAESEFIGGPINITSGSKIKVGDIGMQIAVHSGAEYTSLNKQLSSPMLIHCDNQKAKKFLEWSPETPFEEGLKLTYKWYSNNMDRFS
ncbi:MAG: NAD-dependent epimerase/dehydratase family protein [Candidatus Aenigmarchaeota archaeon]|nr:NAD-dependent epimerase/dehydratase family protein [Candidatus Aenigmarchaeota archaeon]